MEAETLVDEVRNESDSRTGHATSPVVTSPFGQIDNLIQNQDFGGRKIILMRILMEI